MWLTVSNKFNLYSADSARNIIADTTTSDAEIYNLITAAHFVCCRVSGVFYSCMLCFLYVQASRRQFYCANTLRSIQVFFVYIISCLKTSSRFTRRARETAKHALAHITHFAVDKSLCERRRRDTRADINFCETIASSHSCSSSLR